MGADPSPALVEEPFGDDAAVEDELRRRGAILEAVRLGAERFLDPVTRWSDHLPEVLAALAEATGTSRVYLFEHYRWDDDGEIWTTQRFEWSAPGVRSIAGLPELAELPLVAAGFGRWAQHLRRGEPVVGLRRDMRPEEQRQMAADGTLAIAVVPITVEHRWWGMLGFDECAYERVWSAGEIDGLRAAASTIAAAILADRAEAELRAREREYRAVFDAAADGLVVTDRGGRLVTANPAFCRMHGCTLEDLRGRDFRAWIHPDWHEMRSGYAETIAQGGVFTTTAVDLRKDGTAFPVEVRGSAITFRGEPSVLGVVRDITERAEARALLERRVRALSQVAASLTVDQPVAATLAGIADVVVASTDALACTVEVPDEAGRGLRLLASAGRPPGSEDGAWGSTLVLPLDTVAGSGGALTVHHRGGRPRPDDEEAFLRALADQAAVAVENERLLTAARGAAALEERQRLARELHDSVSQALYGIALGARTGRTVAERDQTALVGAVDYVLNLAEAGLAEMRALIFELRPEALASEGIVAALDRQSRALRARHGVEVVVDLDAEPEVALETKQALYRIAQEALHNVVKHAGAARVDLRLARDGSDVVLSIADDGRGFDPTGSFPGHLGLRSMRERVEGAGGRLALDSGPGRGTRLVVTVPTAGGDRAR